MNLKIVVGLLVGLLLVQIIGAIIYFVLLPQLPNPPSEINQTFTTIDTSTPGNGSIKLKAEKSTIAVNEDLSISVIANTDNRPVEGIDLSLKYDPDFLQPVLVNKLPFIPGRLFPDVPFNGFDNRLGVASMSAISSLNQNYIGEGTLSLITFKAKKAGTTTVSIQAEQDNTTDTNMVSDGKEMLTTIEDLLITIER
jgi:hypothetical protein